ncbi:MAG: T9SS type A sorting domain-containing protein [Bacteroidota bacterium]|nr:T9SS type A sorting domain-containing protein [Bacteroidota bacterium]
MCERIFIKELTKRIAVSLILVMISSLVFSQARVVISDNAFLVISNSAYFVIDNGNANALSTAGTGGNIVSESETNRLRWNISNNTGTYVIPFNDPDNTAKIPFTVAITTAGTAGGRIDFSTYDNSSWDNSTYMPSDVTNMNSLVGGLNNSSKVIDRFWIADASHITKPAATLSFTYVDGEWNPAGNSITESNLGAQRFNTPAGNWDTYPPTGTINTITNTVVSVPVTSAGFFRSWTLADNASPLPIELVSFDAGCEGKLTKLNWVTATELNNDFFTIERSTDASNFHIIATINGAGNSSSYNSYSYTDPFDQSGSRYYRLKQTDYDGNFEYFPMISSANCGESETMISAYNDNQGAIQIHIFASGPGSYSAELYDARGRKIRTKNLYTAAGSNSFQLEVTGLEGGIYFIRINNEMQPYTGKINLH